MPPFPETWPVRPILTCVDESKPYFTGRFELQVHPQDMVVPRTGSIAFGVRNPTKNHVQYHFDCKDSGDVDVKKAKGEDIQSGVLKPGEIGRFMLKHMGKKEDADRPNRNIKIEYCVLENKEEIDKAAAQKDELIKPAKGAYHLRDVLVRPGPPPRSHLEPVQCDCCYGTSCSTEFKRVVY